jgi:uncharacterized protein YbjT (DUF2867 family)
MKTEAIIAGSSGLVGSELLQLLLNSNKYSKVYSLVRRSSDVKHQKLEEIVFDFTDKNAYKSLPRASELFCCLGTTLKTAGSQEAFRKVDYDYPLMLAKAGLNNGTKQFHVITALGADANSSIFYNKVKGQLQEAVKKLNFDQLYIYQPSLLVGDRKENRLGEKIAIKVMPLFEFLMIGPIKKYRSIQVEDVAKSILFTAENENKKLKIILSDEIQTLADSHSNS